MAVSVRIEDEAFSDARIVALGDLAGYSTYEALGRMAHVWRLCTQRKLYVLSEVMVRACLGPNGVDAIVGAELAERVEGGIRIRGTEGRIEWLEEKRSTAKAGGDMRAATAEREGGKFVKTPDSKSANRGTLDQRTPAPPAPHQHPLVDSPALTSAPAPAPAPHHLITQGGGVEIDFAETPGEGAVLRAAAEQGWHAEGSEKARLRDLAAKRAPDPEELRAAVLATTEAGTPCFAYLLRILEGNRRPGRQRAPPTERLTGKAANVRAAIAAADPNMFLASNPRKMRERAERLAKEAEAANAEQ